MATQAQSTLGTEHSVDAIKRLARRRLREHWKRFVAEGVVMMVIGAAAAALPNIATLATTILIGWLLVAAGFYGITASVSARHAPGFWSSLALALLAVALGAVFLARPFAAVLTITIALIAYFLAHGLGMLTLAFGLRDETRHWLWLVAGALVDFLLAAIVISGWPGDAVWVIGLIVGINLMFSGLGLTFAAIGVHADA